MARYSGQAWHGPITGAVCDLCRSSECVNELRQWQGGEEIVRLGKFQCLNCINADSRKAKAKRKAQLDAMARCDVPQCKRRGTMNYYAGRVMLCGQHSKRAQAEYQRNCQAMGGLALFLPRPNLSKEEMIRLATKADAMVNLD